jgi:tetratricopeptide (TPR) repeat protein
VAVAGRLESPEGDEAASAKEPFRAGPVEHTAVGGLLTSVVLVLLVLALLTDWRPLASGHLDLPALTAAGGARPWLATTVLAVVGWLGGCLLFTSRGPGRTERRRWLGTFALTSLGPPALAAALQLAWLSAAVQAAADRGTHASVETIARLPWLHLGLLATLVALIGAVLHARRVTLPSSPLRLAAAAAVTLLVAAPAARANLRVISGDVLIRNLTIPAEGGPMLMPSLYSEAAALRPLEDGYAALFAARVLEGSVSPTADPGLWQQALTATRRALAANPWDLTHLEHLGRLRLRMARAIADPGQHRRQAAEAAEVLHRMARLRPDSAPSWLLLGKAWLAADLPDEALDALTTAIDIEPDNTTALCIIGDTHRLLQALTAEADEHQRAALVAYQTAAELDPASARARLGAGLVHEELGNRGAAMGFYRGAAELEPDSFLAHDRLVGLYEDEQRFAEAMAHAQRALEVAPAADRVRAELRAERLRRWGDILRSWPEPQPPRP